MTLKVLKFGGSSVGSPEALLRAAEIIGHELPRGGLVVVSALGGTTDLLLEAAGRAAAGEGLEARRLLDKLRRRHERQAEALGLLPDVSCAWGGIFDRLENQLAGISLLQEASPRTKDLVLAAGETLSAQLTAALLFQQGRPARFVEARDVLHTDGRHGAARPLPAAIRGALRPWRERLRLGELLVTQGFVGVGPDGATTTLGRGGSDTSATLLGEALDAEEVQIWTDVDGILSADPSLVPEARPIPRMSVAEATALTAFGAKVLHADSLAPVARSGTRLRVANTLQPASSRTEILKELPEGRREAVVSVAYKEGVVLLRLGASALLLAEAADKAAQMEEAGALRFGFLATPEGALLVLKPETSAAKRLLDQWRRDGLDVEEGWAVVALVGEGLREDPAARLRLLRPLQDEAVGGLLAGSSAISTAALVREDRLAELIPALHRAWIGEAIVEAVPENAEASA